MNIFKDDGATIFKQIESQREFIESCRRHDARINSLETPKPAPQKGWKDLFLKVIGA